MANFGSSQSELLLRYRLGLEHALAAANFLNNPNLVILQALAIFLGLVRMHENPRYVWMMTGLVVRISQYLGLQRDGTHFGHLTPFEIEMRRRVWWCIVMLDLRASEDQGTDLTIAIDSFDTKLPSNINDSDISPETKKMPLERDGMTDTSEARIFYGPGDIMRQLTVASAQGGSAAGLQEQSRLLEKLCQKFEEINFPYKTEPENIVYSIAVTITRLVMAKMTLIVHLPVLFSSPSEQFSQDMRTKLLVSAIEVAEYNHSLNTEQVSRRWRWVYQTYTHWHAIVYMTMEISRRAWSPIVERAWVSLHSTWLIPSQARAAKSTPVWVPLRKLMNRARKHRDVELIRLRADQRAAAELELEDQNIVLQSSPIALTNESNPDALLKRWRQLVGLPTGLSDFGQGHCDNSIHQVSTGQWTTTSAPMHSFNDGTFSLVYDPISFQMGGNGISQSMENTNSIAPAPSIAEPFNSGHDMTNSFASYIPSTSTAQDSSDLNMGFGTVPWLWADMAFDTFTNPGVDSVSISTDSDSEVNWYNWVESAKGLENSAWLKSDSWN